MKKFNEWKDAFAWADKVDRSMETCGCVDNETVEMWSDGKVRIAVQRDVEAYVAVHDTRPDVDVEVVCWRLTFWKDVNVDRYDNEVFDTKADCYAQLAEWKANPALVR